jgi:hypothetical protein
MKKIFKLLSVIVFSGSLLITYSCSETFLTKEPFGVVPGSVIESAKGVESLLIGVYGRRTEALCSEVV